MKSLAFACNFVSGKANKSLMPCTKTVHKHTDRSGQFHVDCTKTVQRYMHTFGHSSLAGLHKDSSQTEDLASLVWLAQAAHRQKIWPVLSGLCKDSFLRV